MVFLGILRALHRISGVSLTILHATFLLFLDGAPDSSLSLASDADDDICLLPLSILGN